MTRRPPIYIFLGIISAFLYLANLVVFESLAAVLNINSPVYLQILALGLGLLSASFILSTILGNYKYNFFTRFYSTISAIWMGFFTYLFLSSVAYGLIVTITGQLFSKVGVALIGAGILASVYGIFNARKMHVTNVEVNFPNLPAEWKGRKVVWVSDLHLGQVQGSSFAHRVAQKINSISPSMVFIGGDLFDGTSAPDLSKLIAPLQNISVPKGVYFITGNHEEFGNSEKFISAVNNSGMEVLIDKLVEIDGVQIIGVDYKNSAKAENFKNVLNNIEIDPAKPSILLKHEPKDLEVSEERGIHMQISGHTHKAQMWPLNYIARGVYAGYEYGLKNKGKMQVYTSSGVGSWGPPVRVGSKSEIVVFNFL